MRTVRMERALSGILHVSYISRLYETGFTCTNDGSPVGNEMAIRHPNMKIRRPRPQTYCTPLS